MAAQPSKRLYLRNLPKHIGEETLLKHLSSYGRIVEVKIVHDYAFVEFHSEQNARDVLETFRSRPFLGQDIVIEFSRPLRKDIPQIVSTNSTESIQSRVAPTHAQSRYPVVVTNIPRKVRWQELKDFGRMAGALVAYCDLDKKRRGRGFIEFFSKEDAERAVYELDGQYLGGKRVKVCGRPEVYSSRRDRSRSQSPRRPEKNMLYWPLPKYRDDSSTAPSARPSSYTRHQHDSPPPSYDCRDTPAYHVPYPSFRHPSSYTPCASDDRMQAPSNWFSTSYPAVPAYNHSEELYDYAGHTTRLNGWKYDYDRDFNSDCQDHRQKPDSQIDTDRQYFETHPHYR